MQLGFGVGASYRYSVTLGFLDRFDGGQAWCASIRAPSGFDYDTRKLLRIMALLEYYVE